MAFVATLLLLGCCSAAARANTTSVYWDDFENVGPMPNPFPSMPPGGNGQGEDNTAVGYRTMESLTTDQGIRGRATNPWRT
jgi:hypothetical protein